jgi:hypothetical protein
MSCKSWGLPAGPGYCPAYCKSPESPCAFCYASGGRYQMPNVKNTQLERYQWWKNTPENTRIDIISQALNRMKNQFFRVFDSGDFGCPEDIITWGKVIKECPDTLFWIPTKIWVFPDFYKKLLRLNNRLPNVTIRRSSLFLNKPLVDNKLNCTATVITAYDERDLYPQGTVCPKVKYKSCGESRCRACWDRYTPHIEYVIHGHKINWTKNK